MKHKYTPLIIALIAAVPLCGSALTVTTLYQDNTTDNDVQATGNSTSGGIRFGSDTEGLVVVGSSTTKAGGRFIGATSGRGIADGSNEIVGIAQSINVTVSWSILAEDWETYSIALAPEFHGLLNIEDGSSDEPEDQVSFSVFEASLTLNGGAVANTLDLSGGSRTLVGSSSVDDTSSHAFTGLSGNNTIVLTYTGLASATWKTGYWWSNDRTADAVLWGADGTMDGDAASTDGFDNYASPAARDADGLFVGGTVTLDAIPEPSSSVMLILGAGIVLFVRRKFAI